MANRSYLYSVSEIPGTPGAAAPVIRPVSEWKWDIPMVHRVLMTGSPRLCPSVIWDPPLQAIVADYAQGVASLERFFAALPQTEKVRADAAAALAALRDPAQQGAYFLLEVFEILEMGLIGDDEESRLAELAEAYEMELGEIGDIDYWLNRAPSLAPDDLDQATGGGAWRRNLYFAPASAEPPVAEPAPSVASPAAPTTPQPDSAPPQPSPPGTIAWSWGFLALIPFLLLSALVAGAVMIGAGRSQRRFGPHAAEIGRHVANWGMTYLVVTALLGASHFALLYALSSTSGGSVQDFLPLGIPITIWGLVSVMHFIICSVGASKAKAGEVFKPPALPFF